MSPHSWDGAVAPLLKILADSVDFSSVGKCLGDDFIGVAVAALGGVDTFRGAAQGSAASLGCDCPGVRIPQ